MGKRFAFRSLVGMLLVLALGVTVILFGATAAFAAGYTYTSQWGSGPGTGNNQFNGPQATAVDVAGNVYVADTYNNRILVFNNAGVYSRTIGAAGSGAGQFNLVNGIAVAGGYVYASDYGNNRVEKFTTAGVWVQDIATGLLGPSRLAVSPLNGDVYICAFGGNLVYEYTSTGTLVRQWGGVGTAPGQFLNPSGIAIASNGDVYISEYTGDRVQQFGSTGVPIRQWGSGPGTGNNQFNNPAMSGVDAVGNVYVSDSSNNRVQVFSSVGVYTQTIGSAGAGNGQFATPYGLAFDSAGKMFVADSGNNRIEVFSPPATNTPASSDWSLALLAVVGLGVAGAVTRRRQLS